MMISDLSYLEVVTEANSVEGGTTLLGPDTKINSADNSQHSCGNSSYAEGGLFAFSGLNGNNVFIPVQGNNVQVGLVNGLVQ